MGAQGAKQPKTAVSGPGRQGTVTKILPFSSGVGYDAGRKR
jgi:hypothetical protein